MLAVSSLKHAWMCIAILTGTSPAAGVGAAAAVTRSDRPRPAEAAPVARAAPRPRACRRLTSADMATSSVAFFRNAAVFNIAV